MIFLNITYDGFSQSHHLETDMPDGDILRMAAEILEIPVQNLQNFVIDRMPSPLGSVGIYVRPQVPFG